MLDEISAASSAYFCCPRYPHIVASPTLSSVAPASMLVAIFIMLLLGI